MVGRSILALGSALPSLSHSAGFGVLYRNCTIGACVFHVQLERTILCTEVCNQGVLFPPLSGACHCY